MGKWDDSERLGLLRNDFNINFMKPFKQKTGIKYNRNRFGYDFWIAAKGVGINIYDKYLNGQRRKLVKNGIIEYKIKGFDNGDLYGVIKELETEPFWGLRRQELGLSTNHNTRQKQISDSKKGFYETIGLQFDNKSLNK